MTRTIKLAVIPGDGIGVEVTEQANRVLDAVLAGGDVVLDRTEFKLGAERYLATGDTLPAEEQAAIAEHEAIVAAFAGDDARAPEQAMRRHIELVRSRSLDIEKTD